jgi:hypothetical protein
MTPKQRRAAKSVQDGGKLETPGAVVRRAYLAANRGRFCDANRCVAPKLRPPAPGIREITSRIWGQLRRAQTLDVKLKTEIAATLLATRRFADPNFCWKAMTRNRSLESVTVTREVIRGDRATVHLALRLKNGESRTEHERLVRTRAGWLIGDPEHFRTRTDERSNSRLQRPAAASGASRQKSSRASDRCGGR